VSIPRPDGWTEIVAFADGRTTTKPPDELIQRAMAQYLDGMRLPNATVRWSYLESLGLKRVP
jgi:endoglucanase